ncbi:hypothetical protein C0992_004019 [Termitomyces sp. T32_za158]|nr:hypothetical protein C0992_004019 [Termitomyces sp. T32_za158]
MSVQDSALRATSAPLSAEEIEEEILIDLELEPKVFISNIKVSQALTNVDLVIQSQPDTRYDDLAKGAGGSYRYLIPVRQSNQKLFISAFTLARSEVALDEVPEKIWHSLPQGATNDINKGRRGDFLYLVWELQRAYEV